MKQKKFCLTILALSIDANTNNDEHIILKCPNCQHHWFFNPDHGKTGLRFDCQFCGNSYNFVTVLNYNINIGIKHV